MYFTPVDTKALSAHVILSPAESYALLSAHVPAEGAGDGSPEKLELDGDNDATQIPRASVNLEQEFQWRDATLHTQFSRLEGKVLAARASSDEAEQYQLMKRSRDVWIFCQNYLQNYLEEERLRLLGEKLEQVERYLKPIELK